MVITLDLVSVEMVLIVLLKVMSLLKLMMIGVVIKVKLKTKDMVSHHLMSCS